jgi:hypothetical protein
MRRATGERSVLVAVRSAVALYRLLDVLPVFAGDPRVHRHFTLVPGSEFDVDALAAVDAAGARTLPWDAARRRSFDLVLTASPKGALQLLRGERVLLPHGAGFGKTVPSEGSAAFASGLDPAYLDTGDGALALYALAHPGQVADLAARSPALADRARVTGDPTLERLLAARPLRDRYRAALGTGGRRLVVLTSTWGPESLLRRRPELARDLLAHLPCDEYQVALVVHPNERSRMGRYELRQHLAPALDAGLVLPGPYEEWAAVLVAADAAVCDHGSTALYFAAAGGDRPLVGAYDGGGELLPGSPVATLLEQVPHLRRPSDLRQALAAYRPGAAAAAARAAFAEQGRALSHLQRELYALLGLAPPPGPVEARPLPVPGPAPRTVAAFDVHAEVTGGAVRLTRVPAGPGPAGHHLAAEHGAAGERATRAAAVLYRRPQPVPAAPHASAWRADAWTAHVLDAYPAARVAAALLDAGRGLVRLRDGSLHTLRLAPHTHNGRLEYADPAAAVSALHAWHTLHGALPAGRLDCLLGEHAFRLILEQPTAHDRAHPV